jgi:predicted transcriptional regulator
MKEKKIRFDTIHPSETGIRKALGFLEADIMEIIWEKGKISVRNVFEILKDKRDIAYTTVMTTMDRLYKKGLLLRKKALKNYIYWPSISEGNLERHIVKETIKGMFTDLKEPLMSYFAHPETREDLRVIQSFSHIVEELKKELEENESN